MITLVAMAKTSILTVQEKTMGNHTCIFLSRVADGWGANDQNHPIGFHCFPRFESNGLIFTPD